MTDVYAQNIEKLRAQFEETSPITQKGFDDMIEARVGISDEELQETIESVTVGKTRKIYFLIHGLFKKADETDMLSVQFILADTIEDAIQQLEEIGEFVFDDGPSTIPRLRVRR